MEAATTRTILVGTDVGVVYEAEIAKTDKYIKPVYRPTEQQQQPPQQQQQQQQQAQQQRPEPVAALRIEPLPGADAHDHTGAAAWFVFVATARRCLQLLGAPAAPEPPFFAPVFAGANRSRREFALPGDNMLAGAAFHAQFPSPPTMYAWLGACGVASARIDLRHPAPCVVFAVVVA